MRTAGSATGDAAPAFLGHPKAWGMVTLKINSSSKTATSNTVTPSTVVNTGGGTWSYGTVADGIYKGCYSDYIHNTKYHSATAVIANSTDKTYANAGYWADAYAVAGWAYTCNAYWSTY
ncbi:lactococcin 972 family bacteriocin [Streptomyces sp. NPDC001380]|uniref:lactococcin 972 family bacteriocin n=1 Tax=Streptomyces sp. NPDC001380 TaxID=3364566 RepID=UPI0036A65C70